ncbi:MAG: thymidine phosphorylase [Verrucomicrobia bacterium]|nr:thymidine phosphorylase [Verrucomicrobiota bacterium]
MTDKILEHKRKEKPSFTSLIEKKRDGGEFTADEIRQIIDSIMDAEMPEAQQAALAMAIYFKQMSAQETAMLAEELRLSGDVIDLDRLTQPKIAKVSTGGVGDKTSMVLGPLGAAAGVIMPGMNGKDEEFCISTVEKLSSIPGFKGKATMDQFRQQLERVGCAVTEQCSEIAPADDILYKLRQKTGTIPSLPLITGSILSKKLAEGCEGLVIDVKWGNGSFIRDLEQAKQLARIVTRVARSLNRKCVALVTDINQPLGDSVGTGLEVLEAVRLLKGEGPEDLQDLVLKLGMEVVRLAGVAEKFKAMVRAQGGKTDWIDDPEKFPKAKFIRKLPAPKRGYVHTIDAGKIAQGVRLLATLKDGTLDPSVGVTEIRKVGTQVKQGEPLIMIHYNDEAKVDAALPYFRDAYRLAPKRPNMPPLVVERVA